MKNKGYLVFELLVTIGLVVILALIIFRIIAQVADAEKVQFDYYETATDDMVVTYNLNHDLKTFNLLEVNSCSDSINCYELVYDQVTKKLFVSDDNTRLVYGSVERKADDGEEYGDIFMFNNYFSENIVQNTNISSGDFITPLVEYDSILNINLEITNSNFENPFEISVNYMYNNGGVNFNVPILTFNEGLEYNLIEDIGISDPGISVLNMNLADVSITGTFNNTDPGAYEINYSYDLDGEGGLDPFSVTRNIYVWTEWNVLPQYLYDVEENIEIYLRRSIKKSLLMEPNSYVTFPDELVDVNNYKFNVNLFIPSYISNEGIIPILSNAESNSGVYSGFDFIYNVNTTNNYFKITHYNEDLIDGYEEVIFPYEMFVEELYKIELAYGLNSLKLYVNDRLIGSASLNDFKYDADPSPLLYGKTLTDSGDITTFNSYKLYGLKIYNSFDDSLPVGDYDFESSSAPTLNDTLGINDGTITGTNIDLSIVNFRETILYPSLENGFFEATLWEESYRRYR